MPCSSMRNHLCPICVAQRGWEVKGGRVVFYGSMEASASAAEVPAVGPHQPCAHLCA